MTQKGEIGSPPVPPGCDQGGVIEFEGDAAKTYGARVELPEDLAHAALTLPDAEAELVQLHALALRRLASIPSEARHMEEQWRKQEATLFSIIERIRELRYEQRKQLLTA